MPPRRRWSRSWLPRRRLLRFRRRVHPSEPGRTPSAGPVSHEYRPGLAAFPHLPEGVTSAPVVVMIPGGGWETADPSGLEPLAAALAAQGVVAMPVVIRAAADGVVYPTPIEDVLCALADGAATATEAGIRPTALVLLGHSSGAHVSAVATLAPDQYAPRCDDPLVAPDALVGLAGPYDIRELLGCRGEPLRRGRRRRHLGRRQPGAPGGPPARGAGAAPARRRGRAGAGAVQPATSRGPARRRAPGDADIVPGVNHGEVYSPAVAAAPVAEWLAGLPQD